jgi:hypothetical protein
MYLSLVKYGVTKKKCFSLELVLVLLLFLSRWAVTRTKHTLSLTNQRSKMMSVQQDRTSVHVLSNDDVCVGVSLKRIKTYSTTVERIDGKIKSKKAPQPTDRFNIQLYCRLLTVLIK